MVTNKLWVRATLCLALLLWPAQGQTTPELARVLEPVLFDALKRRDATLARAFPAAVTASGGLRVLVRVKPGVAPSALVGPFETGRAAGPVVPVRVAPHRLAELARHPAVWTVEPCAQLRTHLDRSMPDTGALAVHRQLGLDGAGVVLGIIDTGLDFRHRDFQTVNGATRLASLLDYAHPPLKPQASGAPGVRVYSRQELDTQLLLDRALGQLAPNLVLHRDRVGHGTHVAGIAAGTGAAAASTFTAFRFKGVAPGATLIGVQASGSNGSTFHDADVIEGIGHVFQQAKKLGLPAVVNLSIGTQLGPHDGTSNLATAISAFTGADKPGQVVVVSAGNDGGQDIHAVGFPRTDGSSRVVLEIPQYKPTSARELVHLEVWYDGGDLALELTSPSGRSVGPVATGASKELSTADGAVKIINAPGGAYRPNGRYKAAVLVEERGETPVASGQWRLGLTGDALRFDVWLANPAIQGEQGRPRLKGPVEISGTISSPGDGRGVISVAAYSTRGSWNSVMGGLRVSAVQQGQHAFFSSTGPTTDGRLVPDVAAPGEFVISALSMHAYPTSAVSNFFVPSLPNALWHEDQVRGVLRGTSQAAPHVTGAVALLLQRDPRLTIAQVRELLRAGARADAATGQGHGWSPRWGFGKLDIARSLAVLDRKSPGALDPTTSGVGLSRDLLPPGSGLRATVTITPRDSAGLPLGPGRRVQLRATAGQLTQPVHVAHGRYQATLSPGRARLGQRARLTALVDGVELSRHPVVHFTTHRQRVGLPWSARGGGCSVAHGAPHAWLWLVLLLALMRARKTSRVRGGSAITGASSTGTGAALPPERSR